MPERKNDEAKTELNLTRTFDAPRAMVFEAWSRAEHVSKWFTPRPLTTSACELDFRPGGVFRLTMLMPDGKEHPMDGRFGEIVPPEKLTFSATLEDGNQIDTTVNSSLLNSTLTSQSNAGTTQRPAFALEQSNPWVQTINLGLEFRY